MSSSTEQNTDTYRFRPEDLKPGNRLPGISAFMRIKNGADFLEATIRSHLPYFDEIVAVHNQCTDATPDILARLAQEFGPQRLRVFHYLPAVFPPGSDGHRKEQADSPRSLVNYYNFALSQTRHRIATKLDDDHLAMEATLGDLTRRIRVGAFGDDEMICFSGLNVARDDTGKLGILAREPFSGGGDIGFFIVTPTTYFVHDRRFEHFNRHGLRRRFGGIVYWHLKYMKSAFGFANYSIENGANARYARKQSAAMSDRRIVDLAALPALPGPIERMRAEVTRWGLLLPEKSRLLNDRWAAAARMKSLGTLADVIARSSPAASLLRFPEAA